MLRSHRWRTAANSAAYLLPRLRRGMTVLDVGSGPGTITCDLAGLVSPGTVTALETSAETIALTEVEAQARGVGNVEYAVGDVHELPFDDDRFDVVHAHQVLQHVGDPVRALREMRRVCKADGVVAVRDSDYAAMTWYPVSPGLDRWQELYRSAARSNGGQPDAGRRLLSWAHAAGFEQVTASSSTWCFATPEDRIWWSGLWADRMTRSSLADQLLHLGVADRGHLEEIASAWHDWAADRDGWFSVLHGELIARA